ncbi:hypothetical protein BSKO_09966 [Bryopsis sp. KO-2023]|nr:hypothetical protein BSKO_09966 [Bryopsis sp. KO-2023]
MAQGRNTTIYRGLPKNCNCPVVVKAYNKAQVRKSCWRQLELEKELLRDISHPNIIQGLGHWEDEAAFYLVQEHADGRSLKQYLKQNLKSRQDSSIKVTEHKVVKEVVLPLLSALSYLHKMGIVHRDLKPDNIVFACSILKVIDFGLAMDVARDRIKMKVGTLHYMAPEMQDCATIMPSAELMDRVDVWGVAVIAWELLSGLLPFHHHSKNGTKMLIVEGDPPWDSVKTVSSEGKDFLKRGLEKFPEHRPSVEELLEHPWILRHSPVQGQARE